MAQKKRKSTSRRRSRRRTRPQERIPAGLGTLFAGLLLTALAFVQGESVWRTLHDTLFGLLGCGALVLGAAVCCLAVLYTRGEDLLPHITKLALGLVLATGGVIVFTRVPVQGLSASQILAVCYRNGYEAVLSGGALGALLGGTLVALCGHPAADVVMGVLMACTLLYLLDLTPADLWQWCSGVAGGVRDKSAAAYAEGRSRHAQRAEERQARLAERQAEAEAEAEALARQQAEEDPDPAGPAPREEGGFSVGMPGWMTGVLRWGRQVTREEDPAAPEAAAPPPEAPPPEAPAAPPRPRAPFDIDLGPDPAPVTAGSSEPIEPIILGPGGTFGMDPLKIPRPTIRPVVPDAVETPAADFFAPETETVRTPAVPEAPAEGFVPVQPEPPAPRPVADFFPLDTDGPFEPEGAITPAAPPPVSAEHAVCQHTAPDEDGWIRITAEPVEEKDLNTLVAAAMEKPAASEQAAASAPAEEAPPEAVYQYQYPPIELFERAPDETEGGVQEELKANAQKLVDTLESFGVRTRVLDISRGPSVTRYEVQPMAGVKISRITSLADDIALNLAVADVRMEAPIPGKPAVGIEVPNHKKTPVYIRSVFESQSFLRMTSPLGIALGKDIAGVAQVADLCKMPHLLIAGSTGSGKSVCVNSIIMSLLFRSGPEDVKLILIDPKVVELAEYNGIPHLLMPVITEPRKAAGALGSAVQEMERRYRMFAENNVRDIKSFNKLAAADPMLEKMPYIAIVIDELADLMMVVGKDVEDSICRIAQKARAAGMHLIVATQRPSVDVITGLIKANIPSRIAFAVSSQVDSRTILDGAGAEKLLGMGDMLFMPVGASKPIRIQGTFVRDEEISRVLDFIKASGTVQYDEAMIEAMEKHAIQDGKKGGSAADPEEGEGSDPMLGQAVEVVIDAGQASTSLLQRRCKLGYARAARIMDEMEQKGIIGPYEGAKPRAVLISRQQWLEMQMNAPEGQ